jgi:outer membrane protein assembly factor BamC
MTIVKSGNLRWLVVEEEPSLLWPHIVEFWEDLGFRVMIANKRTGIIETEWMDTSDIKIDQKEKGVLSNFDKWLDSLSGFADKRKFRTRIEIGESKNTEIYISQRSAEAAADRHSQILSGRSSEYNPSTIYKIEEYKSGDDSKKEVVEMSEQREIDDYEIDSELLTRLMIKLGATDLYAQEKVSNPQEIIKAKLNESEDDISITMYDGYERAWRRLGLALDIIGFVTEDKDRSNGIYYVRFSEIELPTETKEEDEGLIDSLIFWGDDKEDEEKNDQSNKPPEDLKQQPEDSNEPEFTGIEAPEVKPIDEDYVPEEYANNSENKSDEEETWVTKLWPSWGDDDEAGILPKNEKRYRIRIKPLGENTSTVYLDYPNGKKNISKEAGKVLKIINEHLK